ncbi:protein dopey-1-like [Watersipora subatra]|uniref:protein dopey-1-like n=1 Tax=Watersipora subatra TaxID=2589382 RepID=UPI00355B8ED5
MDNGEQQLSLSDSKFRYYSTLMERALKGFENTREWADLISALSKVNKVISSHKSYNILPKKATIGKRLAQCLHPALPAGVHIKALELYETIFTTIGPAFIAKDFPIYSAGLLPLLGHAAMTVKPVLLTLYETFILPVCSSIRPAAAGVIIGVLPGLEEGSEYHDRTNTLLEKLTKEFGVEHFYFNFCTH